MLKHKSLHTFPLLLAIIAFAIDGISLSRRADAFDNAVGLLSWRMDLMLVLRIVFMVCR